MEKSTETVTVKVTIAKFDGAPPALGEVKEPVETVEREYEVPLSSLQTPKES